MTSAVASASSAPLNPRPIPIGQSASGHILPGSFMNITSPPNDNAIICSSVSAHTTWSCCGNGGVISQSAFNGKTHMEGACWVNSTGGDAWDACVQKVGIRDGEAGNNTSIAVNGTDGKLLPGLAQCPTWADFLSTAQKDVPDGQVNMTSISTKGFNGEDSSAPKENSVLFSSLDMNSELVNECCDKADKYWHRVAYLEPLGGACIFHKDEAEKNNIYDEYWKPCIEGLGLYPVRLNNVTGHWSAGYANKASAGLLVAAAALALLA